MAIGPDRPLQFTLHVTATLEEDGRIFVRLADDVYFEFLGATTLSIGLPQYRHPLIDEEGRFGAYLRMETVSADDGEKLAIWPEVRQITGNSGFAAMAAIVSSFADEMIRSGRFEESDFEVMHGSNLTFATGPVE